MFRLTGGYRDKQVNKKNKNKKKKHVNVIKCTAKPLLDLQHLRAV